MISGTSSRFEGYLPHVILAGLALAMVGVARAKHTSTADATEAAFDDTAAPEDRVWGMHLAANRAANRDRKLSVDLVRSMYGSQDEAVREAALLVDLCRLAIRPPGAELTTTAPPLQEAYAYSPLEDGILTPHRLRSIILHRRKVGGTVVGGFLRLELIEAKWFLASLTGGELPTAGELQNHLGKRAQLPISKRDRKNTDRSR